MELLKLIAVAGLIAFTGFFVAVEFAIVKVRRTKIDQLIIQKKRALLPQKK
ncbi:2-oxo acid dehydrogenase, lipoyl-binding site protein [Bacillus licheniformis]|nr:2-oxo acid dehydrogenase, lipoyl-binding site protein [Bacillus licheniformis]